MDNIGDILSSLSDEDMKALGDAARSLLGSSEQEQGQNDSDRGFSMDPATMAKIAQIMSAMNRQTAAATSSPLCVPCSASRAAAGRTTRCS